MPEIRLEHVTKRWGKFYAVDDLDLVIEDNAFVTLLKDYWMRNWNFPTDQFGWDNIALGQMCIRDRYYNP